MLHNKIGPAREGEAVVICQLAGDKCDHSSGSFAVQFLQHRQGLIGLSLPVPRIVATHWLRASDLEVANG